MRNSFYQSRKFKYGSMATAFTIGFIAIVVIFNIIFTALAARYNWFIDMTGEQVFTLSDEAKEIMSDITDDVQIIFASEPDVLMNGTDSDYMRYVYTTALQLEEEFSNVHVECVNVLKHPSYFREYYNTTNTDIDSDSVVVVSGDEVRIFAAEAFFTFDENYEYVWAYNGEYKMISGIMQVTQTETPIVAFTTEHGEELDATGAGNLALLFEDNGFAVEQVNLANQELDDDCRILVIYNPRYDFIGSDADSDQFNEIKKIDKFLDGYGCLLVFSDPEYVDNLTNLNEFLEEWGISYVSETYIRDREHAMTIDGYGIVTEYQSETLGASIYSELSALSTPPKAMIYKSMPIDILWESGGDLSGSRDVSPVLKSHETSELVVDGEVTEVGSYNVMTISRETRIVDNEYYYSYVIASGSPSFSDGSYVVSNSYANKDILSAAMKAVGRERVLAVLDFKPFDDDEITITTEEANNWTAAMTLVIPVIVAACGIYVVIRRKHA